MKNSESLLAIVMLFGIVVFAIMFRYDYMGTRFSYEARVDRWNGCVEIWNGKENMYKALEVSCQ